MPFLMTEPLFRGVQCEKCGETEIFIEPDEYVHQVDLIDLEQDGWAVFIGPQPRGPHDEMTVYTENVFYCPKHNPERKKAKGKKHRTKGGK